MTVAQFLIDTSALTRVLRDGRTLAEWEQPINSGVVAICPIAELEVLFTARSKAVREHQLALLRALFSWVVLPERVFQRATEVQAALTDRGTHRSAGPVDLLTAAAAEEHGLILLHYDADFAAIAAVTGQPARWVAEPGSID
jgi:predicted nucleic acid-binding protein